MEDNQDERSEEARSEEEKITMKMRSKWRQRPPGGK